MRCQFCGSKSMHKDKERKNFSTGKAVAGAVVFGPVGAAAGFIGKDVEGYRCGMCGNFMETEMDSYTEMQIESAIRSAEIGSSTAMYDYYKRQYPNIENVVKANNTGITERPAMVALTTKPTNGGSTDASVVRETSENIKHAYKNMEWVPNCPVMVDSITIKAIDGTDVLCIQAYNQSNKTLRSIYFHADVFDDTGDKVAETDCVYQGLEVKPGEMLPIEQIFSLNTVVAYRVNLTCQKAAFTDETVWRREVNEKIVVLTPQEEIQKDAFPRYAYVMQQAQNSLKNIAEPIYLPQKEEEYWQCICGSVVGGDNNCPRCGAKYDRLMEMLSQEKLRALQQEAVKKRAKERAKTTENLYENTYSKKYDREYHMAMSLIKNDNVEDLNKAISILEKISTWKDAGSKINTCRNRIVELGKDKTYQEALALYNADDKAEIAKAIPIFEQVLDYKDSKQKVDACKEKIAKIEQKEEQDRITAEEAQRAKEKAKKKNAKMGIVAAVVAVACVAVFMVYSNVIVPNQKYNQAVAFMEEGNVTKAYESFVDMNGYKDSQKKAEDLYADYELANIREASVGDTVLYGAYEQDNDTSNGKEKIEWIILDKKDNKVLLISLYALDNKKYSYSPSALTWESCYLRKWLNSTFSQNAFNTKEKDKILLTTEPEDSSVQDAVFLLGKDEIEMYFKDEAHRVCIPTEYAKSLGVPITVNTVKGCWWWIRMTIYKHYYYKSDYSYRGDVVDSFGQFGPIGPFGDYGDAAVRPAIWVDLTQL